MYINPGTRQPLALSAPAMKGQGWGRGTGGGGWEEPEGCWDKGLQDAGVVGDRGGDGTRE